MTRVHLVAIACLYNFISNGEVLLDDDLTKFKSWFEEHGGKCRCNFVREENGQLAVVSDRKIHDKEAVMMVPQTVMLNATVIESSPLGPSLEINSLTEAQILAEPDVERQAIMHLAQMAVYLLYSVRVQDESWLPYFKMILNTNCNALWSWSETELKELQDKALMNRAQKWHKEITLLTEKIAPKLTELGLFVEGLEPKDLVHAICVVQRSSFNVTSESGHPVTTLVPGLNMFPYQPNISATWWAKAGALRYRYVNTSIEQGENLYVNMNPNGDGAQALFDYGLFVPEGNKFVIGLPAPNSGLRRRFINKLQVKKRVKYSDKFTFKAAGLPYFRVQALSEFEVEELMKDLGDPEKLSGIKQLIKSPSLHTKGKASFSCKEEVVALNTLAVHLRDELSGKVTGIPEDEHILKGTISEKLRTAVSFRFKFKKLVTKYLDIVSARAIETKRECLSRKRDEL